MKVVLVSNLTWGGRSKSSSSWTAPSSCFNAFASKPCKHQTATAAAHLCNISTQIGARIYMTTSPAEDLFQDHWRLKKNLRFKDFSTYRGWQRGHAGAPLIKGCEQPRRLRAAGWNYRGGKSITVTNNSLLWQGKLHLGGPELLMSWYDAPYQPEECQRHQRPSSLINVAARNLCLNCNLWLRDMQMYI